MKKQVEKEVEKKIDISSLSLLKELNVLDGQEEKT